MKIIGYVLAGLGVVVSAVSKIIPLREKMLSALKFVPADSFAKNGIFVGVALVVLGLLILIMGNNGASSKEIPIYHGNKVVGYRRH